MKILHVYLILLFTILALLIGMTACDYEGPTAVWNEDANLGPQPMITAIDPPGNAGGTCTEGGKVPLRCLEKPASHQVSFGTIAGCWRRVLQHANFQKA